MNLFQARKLGVSLGNLRRITRDLKRQGIISRESTKEEIAEALASALVVENVGAFEECRAEDGRDWESFFAALIEFITKLLPLILPLFI